MMSLSLSSSKAEPQRNMQSVSGRVETSPCSCDGLSAHLHPFTRGNLLEATLSSDFSYISSVLN